MRPPLCPYCGPEQAAYDRYAESRARYDAETRLMEGSLTTPERIKAAYAQYGRGKFDWDRSGNYMRLTYMSPMKCPSYEDMSKEVNEAVACEEFDFTREVIRSKDFTVTRVSCQGLTVEETITS